MNNCFFVYAVGEWHRGQIKFRRPYEPTPLPAGALLATASPELPLAVLERLPLAEEAAKQNLERVQGLRDTELKSLQLQLRETQKPKVPAAAKLIRLRHIAGEWSSVFSAETACAKGCSHCCHP